MTTASRARYNARTSCRRNRALRRSPPPNATNTSAATRFPPLPRTLSNVPPPTPRCKHSKPNKQQKKLPRRVASPLPSWMRTARPSPRRASSSPAKTVRLPPAACNSACTGHKHHNSSPTTASTSLARTAKSAATTASPLPSLPSRPRYKRCTSPPASTPPRHTATSAASAKCCPPSPAKTAARHRCNSRLLR